jgi:hypothetical protein
MGLTSAIATGTIGHKTFTHLEAVHELLKHIRRNLRGWMPLLPDSPSGSIPVVTLCPF